MFIILQVARLKLLYDLEMEIMSHFFTSQIKLELVPTTNH